MGLRVLVGEGRAEFRLVDEGGDVVPGGAAWDEAIGPARAAFWEILARRVRQRKDEELAAGLDAHGDPLIPARWRVGRYAGATGPGLMPFREFSRTRLLLAVTPGDGFVAGTWPDGWATILSYHARGLSGKGRPITRGGQVVGFIGIPGATSGIVRDVVGLTAGGVAWSIETARSEWRALFAPESPEDPSPEPQEGRLDAPGVLRSILRANDRRGRGAA